MSVNDREISFNRYLNTVATQYFTELLLLLMLMLLLLLLLLLRRTPGARTRDFFATRERRECAHERRVRLADRLRLSRALALFKTYGDSPRVYFRSLVRRLCSCSRSEARRRAWARSPVVAKLHAYNTKWVAPENACVSLPCEYTEGF